MKKLILFSGFISVLTFASTACNSCSEKPERKYKVLQLYGGWKARADNIREEVDHIEKHYREYTRHDVDSMEVKQLSTEYPYWKELRTYTDDEAGLRKAELHSLAQKGLRLEKFYFDEGVLIFAVIMDAKKDSLAFTEGRGQNYFFVQNTLVLALDEAGEKRDITDKKVRLAGLDLAKEAKQVQTIIANTQTLY